MKASDIPAKIQLPFGAGAGPSYIRTVPVPSQIGITDGAASYTDGFPPLNFDPVAAGGIPPFGQDVNGILNAISALSRWFSSGAPISYDSTFSTAIGGYPNGAVVQSAVTRGLFWLSLADDNTTDPDAGGANWMMAFPRGALNGFVSLSSSTALTAAQLGNYVQIAGATPAAQTFTLCALANVPASRSGMGYWIQNLSLYPQTIKGNAAETIQPLGTNSFTLQPMETIFVSNQDTTQWNSFGSIAAFNFKSSIGTNGYQKLPSGLIMQWGTYGPTEISGEAVIDMAFPLTFPNACLNLSMTGLNNGGSGAYDMWPQIIPSSVTTLGYSAFLQWPASGIAALYGFMWFAIGY